MKIQSIYETVLYGADIAAMVEFYTRVLGMSLAKARGERSAVFRLSEHSMLLIFDAAFSRQAGRGVPEHGTTGAGHVAFSIAAGTYEEWKRVLGERVEHEIAWVVGGRSLYVRDPAGNSVELVEGQVWPAGNIAGS